MKNLLTIFLVVFCGCSDPPSGPQSVVETSAARPKLVDRVKFIENYVKFRRNYEKLEYDVVYQNNGGGRVPGPSDWDIKLLAVVPADEVSEWIPPSAAAAEAQPPAWLTDMPGDIPVAEVTEWYHWGGADIGVDRTNSAIAYRNTTIRE